MSKDPLPESNLHSETDSSLDDGKIPADSGILQAGDDFSDGPSHAAAALLGAQTAFLLDSATLARLQDNIRVPTELLANFQSIADSVVLPTISTEALAGVREALAAASRVTMSTEALTGIREALAAASRVTIPTEALANLQAGLAAAAQFSLPEGYLDQFRLTARLLQESVSIPALYSPEQLALRSREQATAPRVSKTAEAFFDEHAVEITDVRSLLKALSAIQERHHMHKLVWRGQQDAAWNVHSSLYRKLETSDPPSEDRLIAAELTAMAHAGVWGQQPTDALRFFADLQHYGAPTRLLDATVDPEMAAWFATESNPELDERDGRVIAWGRVVRTTVRKMSPGNDELPQGEGALFWHSWTTDEERGRVGWGTGSRTWSWFPPALSDRMRAQRAGFLLEAGPLVTPTVANVISDRVSSNWRVAEITRATSIIGLPSRHDVRTTPNEANLVPLFSLRIAARGKAEIREYLKGKGLSSWTVYPDRGGLVEYLKGPFGLTQRPPKTAKL